MLMIHWSPVNDVISTVLERQRCGCLPEASKFTFMQFQATFLSYICCFFDLGRCQPIQCILNQ